MDKKDFANVPETHKALEYIEYTRTSYIDTGVIPNENLPLIPNNAIIGVEKVKVVSIGKDGEMVEIWNNEQGIIDQECFSAIIKVMTHG